MKVCIAGLAKSGTSALYTAVKTQMPPETRCVFEPNSSAELNYVTNGDEDGLAKIMFTSLSSRKYNSNAFDKNLFIVRDPRDIVVSSLLYRFNRLSLINNEERFNRLLQLFKEKEENPSAHSLVHILNRFEKNGAKKYRSSVSRNYRRFLTYIDDIPNHYILKYEDFVVNNTREASEYLELKIERPERLGRWIDKISRKGTSGDWKHWFQEDDTDFFADQLNPILKQMEYDLAWKLACPQIINHEHCSGYILRLAESRKMDPNTKDPSKLSLKLLESAAEDGKTLSLHRLGRKHLSGDGCEQDLRAAQTYLQRAVDLKHEKSYFWLGESFWRQKNYRKAIIFFTLSAQIGPRKLMSWVGRKLGISKKSKKQLSGIWFKLRKKMNPGKAAASSNCPE